MNNWNNLSNNKITLYLTNTSFCSRYTGIKVVTTFNSDEDVIAAAFLPNSVGSPGHTIRINTNGSRYSSNDIPRFTRALTHEFGHTLGYRHTNQTNGSFINGSSTNDPASIMNSSLIASEIGSGFSSADITAHNLKYPNASAPTKDFDFSCP